MNRLFVLFTATYLLASQGTVANPTLWKLVQKAKDTPAESDEWKAVMEEVAADVNVDLTFAPDPGGPTLKQVLAAENPTLLAKIKAGIDLCDGCWLQVSSACGTSHKNVAWQRVETLLKANHDRRWLFFRPSQGFVSAGCLILIYNRKLFERYFEGPQNEPALWSRLGKAVVEGGEKWTSFLKHVNNDPGSLYWRAPTGESIIEIVRLYKFSLYELHLKFPTSLEANYKDASILGAGAGGLVWQATRRADNRVVAIKPIRKALLCEWGLVWPPSEVTLQKKLTHDHILTVVDSIATDHTAFLVTERMPQDFFDYLLKRNHLSEQECRVYMAQILSAVDYMHGKNICHRDLKLENMLLDKDGKIKIADFGFAVEFGEEELTLPCGSPDYVPPEILQWHGYFGPAVDIWALGVGFVVMATGHVPFSSEEKIVGLKYSLAIPVSAAFATLIAGIFRYADTRLTMAKILASEFMTVASDDKLK